MSSCRNTAQRFLFVSLLMMGACESALSEEYLDPRLTREIEANTPYLLIDDYFIDNRFNEDQISARVPHVLQKGKRLPAPVMTYDPAHAWEEHGVGYVSVMFDAKTQKFRLYYQIWNPRLEKGAKPRGGYRTCYAESDNGIDWLRPLFDLEPYGDIQKTNILMSGEGEAKAPHVIPGIESGETRDGIEVRNLGMLPKAVLRGNAYLMFYCDHSHYLATSEDGIRWKQQQSKLIPNRVDCFQSIVYDPKVKEYAIYYRNKLIYGDRPKDDPSRGNTRFMSRLAGKDLWTLWNHLPVPVMIPDGEDDGRFYNMPVMRYGDVYLGFVSQFAEKPQRIEVELVYSRDGFDWRRLPGERRIIACGAAGSWDSGMTFSADRILEVGDEWWLYYTGHDGYHDSTGRKGALGLIKFGKERLVSIQADSRGKQSFVVSRPIVWPGGDLVIKADAAGGSVRVAVTDLHRQAYKGFSIEESVPLTGDEVRHKLAWRGGKMDSLKGKAVRIEFWFQDADLYAFLADEGQ
jgi:hypothetical protein